jgi:hypothetical protein
MAMQEMNWKYDGNVQSLKLAFKSGKTFILMFM